MTIIKMITCHSMARQHHKTGALFAKENRWQPTHCCRSALFTAADWPRFSHKVACWPPFFTAAAQSEESIKGRWFTFLCLPLNTTAKAPCPTRSFLLYSKSPTVSIAMGWCSRWCWALTDGLKCPSLLSDNNSTANDPLSPGGAARLFHEKLFPYVARCINRGCHQDKVHSHAL